jgi:hypothetical protein
VRETVRIIIELRAGEEPPIIRLIPEDSAVHDAETDDDLPEQIDHVWETPDTP